MNVVNRIKRNLKSSSSRFDGVGILSAKYVLFQAIGVLHIIHSLYCFLHCFYSLNLFYMTCMQFFSKRFSHVARHVEGMYSKKILKRIDNRKLFRLVVEHNRIHRDLILINDFFKFYIGFNLVSFFAFGTTGVFVVLLDIGWWSVNLIIVWLRI